ncbi:hypothetical protein BGZ80_005089 [Entomortierella chlamydospora]|uniref:Cytochrome b561 domain-containing protein n=1 Tax=Entomortierella chlamydospora TaxID=101097 RepID=A0A9P6MZP7_9FUNG|nr:hypothetical protein BGZ79_007646 [Entomortierella chlamydospora]KAG0019906.1 hypothetical protein BGZ80_005089 [Entomortierella chlamydospora]
MEESQPFLASSPPERVQQQQETHTPEYHAIDIRNKNNNTLDIASDSDSEQEIIGPTTVSSSSSSSSSNTPSYYTPKNRILRRRIQMSLSVISQLGVLSFFGTLASVIFKAPWAYPYSWHPICMGLYGFVATEAILILQPIERASDRKTAATIHGYLQSLALIFSLIGFVAIYENKELKQKQHFHTNHAFFGCTAVFIFFFQVLFGVVIAYLPRRIFNWIGYARVVRIHRVAGYISIASLWATLWLGTLTNWMKRNFDHEWIFALALGMIAVGLVGQITPSRLYLSSKRVPTNSHLS